MSNVVYLNNGRTLNNPKSSSSTPNPIVKNSGSAGTYDENKAGVSVIIRVADGYWVRFWETLQTAAPTNGIGFAQGSTPWVMTKDASNAPIIVADTGAPVNGEVCATDVFFNPATQRFHMYGHSGNNTGPRYIWLRLSNVLTARDTASVIACLKGTWTLWGTVLSTGTSGQWDDKHVAGATVKRYSDGTCVMTYRGTKVSNNVGQTGRAISTDGGFTFTKYVSNPVVTSTLLGLGASGEAIGHGWMLDENERAQGFSCGNTSQGGTQSTYYGYSDDRLLTFTYNGTAVLTSTGVTTDADYGTAADKHYVYTDGHFLYTDCEVTNFTGSYAGAPPTNLDGRGSFWVPKAVATTPTITGRVPCFLSGAREWVDLPKTKGVLNQTQFSMVGDFKCPPGNVIRRNYCENVSGVSKVVNVWIDANGKLNASFNTGGTPMTIISAGRYDDGEPYIWRFDRTGASAWELRTRNLRTMAAWVSVGTSTVAAGTTATSPTYMSCFNNAAGDAGNPGDRPLLGLSRRFVLIIGGNFADADCNAILANDMQGTAPTIGGATVNFDILWGNTTSETAAGVTVTGTTLVDGSTLGPLSLPLGAKKRSSVAALSTFGLLG